MPAASGSAFVDQLKKRFPQAITGARLDVMDPWIEVAPESIVEVGVHLRDTKGLEFNMLNSICVVDYLEVDPKKAAKVDWQPHLELVYHLSSITHKTSLVVKVMLPRWKDDVVNQIPEIDSVSDVWRTAEWHEREVYDLSGVWFLGNPDLRRILLPEDWAGHPLRKDYEMPTEYHGIRNR